MINRVNGDILNTSEDIICQQVNCMGVMGLGLAKQIRNKYPEVYEHYHDKCVKENYSRSVLLGGTLMVEVFDYNLNDFKTIANIFGQYRYGRNMVYTDYDALEKGFSLVKDYAKDKDYSIAIPFGIGCGLAGGDWDKVYWIIKTTFDEQDVTIYKYE